MNPGLSPTNPPAPSTFSSSGVMHLAEAGSLTRLRAAMSTVPDATAVAQRPALGGPSLGVVEQGDDPGGSFAESSVRVRAVSQIGHAIPFIKLLHEIVHPQLEAARNHVDMLDDAFAVRGSLPLDPGVNVHAVDLELTARVTAQHVSHDEMGIVLRVPCEERSAAVSSDPRRFGVAKNIDHRVLTVVDEERCKRDVQGAGQ